MKSKDCVEEDCHEANAAKSPSFTATKLSHPQMLMYEHSEILTKVEACESHKANDIAERNSMNKTAQHHLQSVLHIAYNMSSRRKAMAALFSSRRKIYASFVSQQKKSYGSFVFQQKKIYAIVLLPAVSQHSSNPDD
jgi:hypothetical protein